MSSVWSLSSSLLSLLGRGEVKSPQNAGVAQQDEESGHHLNTHPTLQQTHAQNEQDAAVTTFAQHANAEGGVNRVSGDRMGPPLAAPGGLRLNALAHQPVRSAARSTSSVSSGHSGQISGDSQTGLIS